MRCPSCNKFPSLETDTEPEVDVEVSEADYAPLSEAEPPEGRALNTNLVRFRVSGSCRIALTSSCCGDEVKESNFDIDAESEMERAEGCTCDLTELEAEMSSAMITDRSESQTKRIAKRGPNKGQEVTRQIPYRYQKRFYGAEVEIEVKCECGKTSDTVTFSDEVSASGMDEMS